MSALHLKHLNKTFDNGQVVVRDADFVVEDGELLVLVGPSGCGKSTLLRLIAGLETATAGQIMIGDRDVTHVAPRDRDIAMVFQNYALYPHMSVAENLSFGLRLRKQDDALIAQRINEAAELLGLQSLLERRPAQLSGGQRQRVALGRALVRHPAIFLLDEPLSNLDAKLRTSVRTEIARLHRTLKTTMVYVTHDQIEAMTLGHRIVVMKSGEVQQIDTPMNIYRRPVNIFVAGFLGSPAMNFLPARQSKDGTITLLQGDSRCLAVAAPIDADRELLLGLRPESARLAEGARLTDEIDIACSAEVIERVGSETFIYAKLADRELIVRASPDASISAGGAMTVRFDLAALHVFDAHTEQRLDLKLHGGH